MELKLFLCLCITEGYSLCSYDHSYCITNVVQSNRQRTNFRYFICNDVMRGCPNGVVVVMHIRQLVLEWRKELSTIGLAGLQQIDDIYALAYQCLCRSFWRSKIVDQVSKVIPTE